MNIIQLFRRKEFTKNLPKIWGKQEKQETLRNIFYFNGNFWGNSFEISAPKEICVGDKCEGHGFTYHRGKITEGTLVCQTFNNYVVVFKITKIRYCYDPDDMFFWEGIRLSPNDLSDTEKEQIRNRYD